MPPNQQSTETAIISISQKVSIILPFAITIGGIFSQFSAAIADTMGCGGIIVEYTKKWISLNAVYILTTACAIFLFGQQMSLKLLPSLLEPLQHTILYNA